MNSLPLSVLKLLFMTVFCLKGSFSARGIVYGWKDDILENMNLSKSKTNRSIVISVG